MGNQYDLAERSPFATAAPKAEACKTLCQMQNLYMLQCIVARYGRLVQARNDITTIRCLLRSMANEIMRFKIMLPIVNECTKFIMALKSRCRLSGSTEHGGNNTPVYDLLYRNGREGVLGSSLRNVINGMSRTCLGDMTQYFALPWVRTHQASHRERADGTSYAGGECYRNVYGLQTTLPFCGTRSKSL